MKKSVKAVVLLSGICAGVAVLTTGCGPFRCMNPSVSECPDNQHEVDDVVCDDLGSACTDGPRDCRGELLHCVQACDGGEEPVYSDDECRSSGEGEGEGEDSSCREVVISGHIFLCDT